jgi:hypothetical protein
MCLDAERIVTMTAAIQNFSAVARQTDQAKMTVTRWIWDQEFRGGGLTPKEK